MDVGGSPAPPQSAASNSVITHSANQWRTGRAPLSLSSSVADFSAFLLETFGIEGNTFTVADARDAARSKSGSWDDFCEKWKQTDSRRQRSWHSSELFWG